MEFMFTGQLCLQSLPDAHIGIMSFSQPDKSVDFTPAWF
jgi:hypothetical protein